MESETIKKDNKMHSAELFFIDKDKLPFSVGYYSHPGCDMHWHHSWEVLCQIEGETFIQCGMNKFTSEKGDITVIAGEKSHKTAKLSKEHKILLLQFQMDSCLPYFAVDKDFKFLATSILLPFERVEFFRLKSNQIETLLHKMSDEYLKKPLGYEIRIQAYIMELFTLFLRNNYIQASEFTSEEKKAMEKVKESIIYIEKHYKENISLEQAANISCLSVSNFCRTFKKATNYTFIEYLNYFRMIESEKLVLSTDMPISEIAYMAGFSSISYFNRRFKQQYHMNPLQYRKTNGVEELM